MRFVSCAILAVVLGGCGAEQEARPEPVAEERREPIVQDAHEAADWISEALTSSGYEADFSIAGAKELDRFFDDHLARRARRSRAVSSTRTSAHACSRSARTSAS